MPPPPATFLFLFLCLPSSFPFTFYPSSLPPPFAFPFLASTADQPSAVDICISIGWLKIYNYAAPVGKNGEKNFSTCLTPPPPTPFQTVRRDQPFFLEPLRRATSPASRSAHPFPIRAPHAGLRTADGDTTFWMLEIMGSPRFFDNVGYSGDFVGVLWVTDRKLESLLRCSQVVC